MRVSAWDNPVVIDLQGLEKPNRKIPVLKDHSPSNLVGHTTKVEVLGKSVRVEGLISGNTEAADQVAVMGKREFPWQASVGLNVSKVEVVGEGESAIVNGRRVDGPVDIARKATFREVSFVAWGADSSTTATVSAKEKGSDMWEEILQAMGVDPATITDEQRTAAEALLARKVDGKKETDKTPADKKEKPADKKVEAEDKEDPIAAMRAAAVAEQRRITAITTKFSEFTELSAKAIEEGWDEGRQDSELRAAKAEKLVKDRAGAGIDTFNIVSKSKPESMQVVEAALAMTMGIPSEKLMKPIDAVKSVEDRRLFGRIVKPIPEKVLDMADEHFRGMGLKELCLWAAQREDKYMGIWGDGERALQAAFSTVVLPTVFQNVANRAILAAYEAVPLVWPKIAKPSPARDFREVKRFRVHGSGRWERLGDDSTLKHGMLGEGTKYTNRLSTDGQMLTLARADFINDDVGALTDIATMMANYGTLAPEIGVVETLLANAGSFFHASNGNLKTGAGSAFGPDGLKDLYTTFSKRKDGVVAKDSRVNKATPYISVDPEILLVPAELFVSAFELTNSSVLQSGGSTRQPTSNFFANRFEVVKCPYLADTLVHANASATAYYLFARPTAAEAISILFLNGVQRPTVQSVPLDASVLGVGFRGYIDYGTALVDPNAAAKANGA